MIKESPDFPRKENDGTWTAMILVDGVPVFSKTKWSTKGDAEKATKAMVAEHLAKQAKRFTKLLKNPPEPPDAAEPTKP